MYAVGGRQSPCEIRFTDLPPGWRIATALTGAGRRLRCRDYDRLVDSPVETGTLPGI